MKARRATLKELNTPEPKERVMGRLLIECCGKPADVTISSALEFRREQYGLSEREFAYVLGLQPSHYNEIVNGRRDITKKAMRRAFAIGVPAEVLLQPSVPTVKSQS